MWCGASCTELDITPHCDNSKCSSNGADCCAPAGETPSCSAGYYGTYVGKGCHGQSDGLYTCCNIEGADERYWDMNFGPSKALESLYLALGFFLGFFWFIALFFCCTCCKSRQWKGPAWIVGVSVCTGAAVGFHAGLSPAMSESQQHGLLMVLGLVGDAVGFVVGYIIFAILLPKMAPSQAACKRPGCPYQGHPFMEHGFCCDECQKKWRPWLQVPQKAYSQSRSYPAAREQPRGCGRDHSAAGSGRIFRGHIARGTPALSFGHCGELEARSWSGCCHVWGRRRCGLQNT